MVMMKMHDLRRRRLQGGRRRRRQMHLRVSIEAIFIGKHEIIALKLGIHVDQVLFLAFLHRVWHANRVHDRRFDLLADGSFNVSIYDLRRCFDRSFNIHWFLHEHRAIYRSIDFDHLAARNFHYLLKCLFKKIIIVA